MKKILYSSLLIILSSLYFPVLSGDAIAVNELVANGVSKGEASSLTDVLRVEIGKTGKFEVMERSQMESVLKEQGFQQSGACGDATCAVEIGQLLAVKYIVLGTIGKVGKTYTANIRLVDVATGKIISDIVETHKGSVDVLLTDKIPLVAKKLAGTYKKRNKGVFIASVSAVVVAGVVVPVVVLLNKDDGIDPVSTTGVKIIWGE